MAMVTGPGDRWFVPGVPGGPGYSIVPTSVRRVPTTECWRCRPAAVAIRRRRASCAFLRCNQGPRGFGGGGTGGASVAQQLGAIIAASDLPRNSPPRSSRPPVSHNSAIAHAQQPNARQHWRGSWSAASVIEQPDKFEHPPQLHVPSSGLRRAAAPGSFEQRQQRLGARNSAWRAEKKRPAGVLKPTKAAPAAPSNHRQWHRRSPPHDRGCRRALPRPSARSSWWKSSKLNRAVQATAVAWRTAASGCSADVQVRARQAECATALSD